MGAGLAGTCFVAGVCLPWLRPTPAFEWIERAYRLRNVNMASSAILRCSTACMAIAVRRYVHKLKLDELETTSFSQWASVRSR